MLLNFSCSCKFKSFLIQKPSIQSKKYLNVEIVGFFEKTSPFTFLYAYIFSVEFSILGIKFPSVLALWTLSCIKFLSIENLITRVSTNQMASSSFSRIFASIFFAKYSLVFSSCSIFPVSNHVKSIGSIPKSISDLKPKLSPISIEP